MSIKKRTFLVSITLHIITVVIGLIAMTGCDEAQQMVTAPPVDSGDNEPPIEESDQPWWLCDPEPGSDGGCDPPEDDNPFLPDDTPPPECGDIIEDEMPSIALLPGQSDGGGVSYGCGIGFNFDLIPSEDGIHDLIIYERVEDLGLSSFNKVTLVYEPSHIDLHGGPVFYPDDGGVVTIKFARNHDIVDEILIIAILHFDEKNTVVRRNLWYVNE